MAVYDQAHRKLPEVVEAFGPFGPLLGPRENGQQQRGQDANDGDHHQKFDQGEAASAAGRAWFPGCAGQG